MAQRDELPNKRHHFTIAVGNEVAALLRIVLPSTQLIVDA